MMDEYRDKRIEGVEKLWPLSGLLHSCGLSLESFVQLLRGCLESGERRWTVLVALEEGKEYERQQRQLSAWCLRLLPLGLGQRLRRAPYFDQSSCEESTLGFLPRSRVREREGRLGVLTREGWFSGTGCLIVGERVVYTSAERPKEELFCDWLERFVRQIYLKRPREAQSALNNLEKTYISFERLMKRLPPGEQTKLKYYSALCWNRFYRESPELALPETQEQAHFRTLLSFGGCPEVIAAVDDRLETLDCEYESPAAEGLLRLLSQIIRARCGGLTELRARELLAAFLSKDMEMAESGESSAVSARYFRVLEDDGLSRREQLELLERVFFPQDFPIPASLEELGVWEGIGTIRSEQEGLRRCSDWVSGYVNICSTGDELLTCGGTILRELEGMERGLLGLVLKSLLAAQEVRFHFARFEITPANLVECCRIILYVQDHPELPYAAEQQLYYRALFQQLSTDLMVYLNRKYSLSTILALSNAFEGKPEWELGWQTVCALTLTQCEFIGAYNWENLKLRFAGEGKEILQRLWQVLDLLDRMFANREVADMVCHQTCRYLIHAVPDYFDERWALREVRELPNLDSRGYYQELLALKSFLRREERSLETLKETAVSYRLSEGALKDLMKLIYRLFRRKSVTELSLTLIEGIFVAAGEKMKLTQLEVFQDVADCTGLEGLAELLEQWPSAPYPPGTPKWKHRPPREGAYPWLQVTRRLMDTLVLFSQDGRRLKGWSAGHADDLWRLMEAVDRLAPAGSVARHQGVQVNENLYRLWIQDQKLLKKLTSKSRKRRLLAE